MAITQNLVPNEPELKDLLNQHAKSLGLSINCHHIGTVQSFDETVQTARVTINYKKTFFEPDATGNYQAVLRDYPLLIDCPVVTLAGGTGALTFPIASGDECLVLFNDRDLDNWFAGSSGSAVATPRLHSFSDAMVLVGVRSLANVIPLYSTSAVELRTLDGATKIAVQATKVVVTVATTGLVAEFDATGKFKITNATGEFVAALITFLQTAMAGGYPIVGDLTTLQSFME